MRKEQRLRKAKDFAAVRREGRSWADRPLVLATRRNGLGVTRFGFIIGKRIGNAVVRNKIKRRLREISRLTELQEGWDVVFIARTEAASADYQMLSNSARELFRRARVLNG
jgi:ribonuclease P protein component